ncbi:hypothetical protein QFC22_003662 [Naganishia vaughanmartiniae]|uniref:Uncharacterized protein n=1 Tax=Naganishia vaughanmartiniae TaxID=1424756 RepID=A0ACC2X564_9TREE|nr:hypothetical protein QFC22_003662 [Naganishia vaughanmartiniae]
MKLVVTDGANSWNDVKWDESVVRVVSLQEARELKIGIDETESVESIDGTSVNPKDVSIYHLIGEMFLGAWRTYTSILAESSDAPVAERPFSSKKKTVFDRLPAINRFSFVRVNSERVYDHANLNDFFLSKVFPHAEREFVDDWRARASSKKLYRFERAIIADRKAGHLGGGPKPMFVILTSPWALEASLICLLFGPLHRDKAFELPVPSTWISDMKDRILRNYQGSVTLQDPGHRKSKPVITYLSRQTATFRRLKQETHEELVAGLQSLEQEGIAEVHVEEFADGDAKEDQVAKLSRTTVRGCSAPRYSTLSSVVSL